ncbi:MAG TPA: hypothetical protein VF148_04585 [Acidimicrobiia bacterium]
MLTAAGRIFIEAWASWALDTNTSSGLIPAYLGLTAGMIGFDFVVY